MLSIVSYEIPSPWKTTNQRWNVNFRDWSTEWTHLHNSEIARKHFVSLAILLARELLWENIEHLQRMIYTYGNNSRSSFKVRKQNKQMDTLRTTVAGSPLSGLITRHPFSPRAITWIWWCCGICFRSHSKTILWSCTVPDPLVRLPRCLILLWRYRTNQRLPRQDLQIQIVKSELESFNTRKTERVFTIIVPSGNWVSMFLYASDSPISLHVVIVLETIRLMI